MKHFLVLLSILFCGVAHADTVDINWYVGDSVYDTSTCTVGGDIILPTAPTKRGHTFQGWIAYTPIEYIESTGSQYIDTGISPHSENVIYEASWVEPSLQGGSSLFGSAGKSWSGVLYHPNLGCAYLAVGNSDGTCSQCNIIAFEQNHVRIILKNGSLIKTQNNQTCNASYAGTIVNNANISLFADSKKEFIRARLYYFKMYDDDVLVRDMIPVLDKNGIPCMYDKVSDTFFYNQNAGNFIAGPVVGSE